MTATKKAEPSTKVPQVVITDIDGTLTDRARRMDLGAADALAKLRERKVPVIFATGNVLPVVLGLHRFLGMTTPIIAENGGLVFFDEHHMVRLSDRQVALRAYEQARKTLPVQPLFTDRWRETEVALEPTIPVHEVEAAVRGMGVKVESTGFALHLFEPSAGKLPAARVVLDELGLSLQDCLVAGDGDNDVELLRAAGVGVSFPDASPAARKAASWVTRSSHGAGFVEALIRCGLLPVASKGRAP